MDISNMTIEELKALCYDQIVLLNQAQANINVIQAELQKREATEQQVNPKKKD
jgi:phosphoribosyl-ATP pyrophosphohydrolase